MISTQVDGASCFRAEASSHQLRTSLRALWGPASGFAMLNELLTEENLGFFRGQVDLPARLTGLGASLSLTCSEKSHHHAGAGFGCNFLL